jgi:hypothetical protein
MSGVPTPSPHWRADRDHRVLDDQGQDPLLLAVAQVVGVITTDAEAGAKVDDVAIREARVRRLCGDSERLPSLLTGRGARLVIGPASREPIDHPRSSEA